MKALILLVGVVLITSGCSVFMAMSGNEEPNLGAVRVGSTRGEVELQLKQPVSSVTNPDGTRTDIYEYELGNKPSGGRAVAHGVLDILTLGLWEVVGTPVEALQGTTYRITVVYGSDDRVVAINSTPPEKKPEPQAPKTTSVPEAAKSISTEGIASGQSLRVGDSVDIVKRLRGEPLGQFSWQRWMTMAFPGPKSSQLSLAIFRDGILTTSEVKECKTLPKGEVITGIKQGDVAEVWGEPHKMFFEGQEQAWIYAEADKLHVIGFEGGTLKTHEVVPLLTR